MKRSARKLIACFLALILALGLGIMASAEDAHTRDGVAFTAWESNESLPDAAGSYYLIADVTLSATWTVPDGTTNLDLNGKTIRLETGKSGSVVSVPKSAALNLYDADGDKGVITGGTGTPITGEDVKQYSAGGGVYIDGGFKMNGGTISGNTAARGGGVYVGEGSSFGLAGGVISGNKTTDGGGGGVYTKGAFALKGGAISGNTSTRGGGGVGVGAKGDLTMSGGVVAGNTSMETGGGIWVFQSGAFTMSGGTVTGNTATLEGGGLCFDDGSTGSMSRGVITGNTAIRGGGVYVDAGASFTMDGGDITRNISTVYGGGAVSVGGTFTMSGGTVLGNTSMRGGAVTVYGGATFTMNGGDISGNESKDGGGVFVFDGGAFTMKDGVIGGNTALASGGGVMLRGGTFTMESGRISGNTALGHTESDSAERFGGGGVAVDTGAVFTLNRGVIRGNVAERGGGFMTKGTVTMNGGAINGNKAASGSGGGVSIQEGTFVIKDGTISGNTTVNNGGGVHIRSGALIMDGGAITGNVAECAGTERILAYGGGGVWNSGNGTFTQNGGTVSGNVAQNGSDVLTYEEGMTPVPATKLSVVRSTQKVTVNGEAVTPDIYNIGGSNYFKLRDLAMLLSGTHSQFNVAYDGATDTVKLTTHAAYTPVGGELETGEDLSVTCAASKQSVEIDGSRALLTAYNIGGSNYFKLRELGAVCTFDVDFDSATDTAAITTR